MTVRELMEKRAGLIKRARGINEKAVEEGRDLTAEEKNNYDSLIGDAAALGETIKRDQALATLEAELEAPQGDPHRMDPQDRGNDGDNGRRELPKFESRGLQGLGVDAFDSGEWRALLETAKPTYRRAFDRWMRVGDYDRRALQVDVNTSGGYLVTPVQMVDRMIQAIDNLTFIRQWATVFSVPNADSLGVVSLNNDPADPTWTSELAIGDEDSTMDFGNRALRPHPLAKYIKISNTLLRKVPSVENLAINRLAYKFGVTMEANFLTGNGSQQPLGVFTASADGIPTSRDVISENTTTAMTYNGLINAKYTLKQPYWARARWLFHTDGMKQLVKIKDSNGQYIWRESVRAGEPDRLLNIPISMSEYAPNTFTAGQYVGILGDFSNYWIADALDMSFQRLVEKFAETNQTGLVGRLESDGQPVLAEAFVRVQLAAS